MDGKNITENLEPGRYETSGFDVTFSIRWRITAQLVLGAELFARKAQEIEERNGLVDSVDEETLTEYRAYIVSVIMQAVAALESQAWEILHYGPGSHLSSSEVNRKFACYNQILHSRLGSSGANEIDRKEVLARYNCILSLLNKTMFEKGKQPYQNSQLLIDLRNHLVHYKSESVKLEEGGPEDTKLDKKFRSLGLETSPYTPSSATFSQKVLSASCASWAVKSTINFIDEFYRRLEIDSPLKPYESRLHIH